MTERLSHNQFEQTQDISIEHVAMSLRLHGFLQSKSINTLQKIVAKGADYFTQEHIQGFAPKDFTELETILTENNLTF